MRHLVGDVGTGVAQAYDKDRTVGELVWTAIVGRVELADPRIQSASKFRDVRPLEGAGGDDHLIRLIAAIAR